MKFIFSVDIYCLVPFFYRTGNPVNQKGAGLRQPVIVKVKIEGLIFSCTIPLPDVATAIANIFHVITHGSHVTNVNRCGGDDHMDITRNLR